ncbi:MAG: SIR2 family protein, partial [Actinobacteria bacterium]|nr:SIR2 family protein [Actinomycetota bacterium]
MRIGGIDFPPEVWDAHQEGKLVIFAGAGVSMDPPSNYPDFENLVRQVAEGTLHKLESEEKRLDLFLGRMEHDGVKVHEQVKEVLTNPDSQPNHFHDSIVRLFKDSNNLRIITTNFDQHFTTVIRDTGFPVDIYKAPALPVGSRFQGLVYLHGCVDSPADRLVLTDSDFGRAYMTEGWALRFLLGVYTSFTVLFIGYSHDDLVLTYLTRGLSPETARLYALTPKDKSLDKWRFLGIEPVLYQLQDEENNHVALREAVLRWAEITLMGALDHEALIRQSLNAGPPLRETEEDDYLQDVVQDPVRIRFFIRHANRTEWHLWAEERGLLSPLFSQEIESNEMIGYLADWFASELVAKEPGIALGIFERQGQTMSISLWWAIALLFHRADSIHKDALPKWLPLLIQHHKPGVKVDVLEYLFDKCTAAEECSLALLLFQFLTRPIIRLEKSFMLEDRDAEQASSAIDILGSHHWIHDALEKCFKPNIAEVSRDLARISSHQIRIAFELGRCHRIAHHEWDGLSYRRSAIEPHEQDEHPRDFDAVIDSCRDSLEWLLDHDYTCGRILINEWIESPAPLLRRLAVHGTTEDTGMSADDKLRWVLEHELVGSLIIHHEIYRLLEKVYPETSGALRRALIEQARHSTESKISANPDADPDIYRHGLFVLITWLDDAAGGSCPIVQDQLEIIKKEHPQWKVSEHPDFTSWMSSGWGNESPICAEELRRISVTETISLLHSYKEDDVLGPSRDGLLEQFAVAVKEDPGWGLRITRKLAETSEEAVDVWDR